MFIVVAEKSSVAMAIKDALPPSIKARVEWVRGHIMDIDLPTTLRLWRLETVEDIMDVRKFRYTVRDRESYSKLSSIFSNCKDDDLLVIATDNDHEGELIGYEVLMLYRNVRKDGKYYRMRFNSTDRREILGAWNRLESSLNWRWVSKAMFRHKFDLLTGAAYTRLLTLSSRMGMDTNDKEYLNTSISKSIKHGTNRHNGKGKDNGKGLISWGSCQTPTLNFIVEREREIENFKPVNYWYIEALIEHDGVRFKAKSKDMYEGEEYAMQVYESCRNSSKASVLEYKESAMVIHRPLPLRTDDALRDLVRITGKSAAYILDVMEDLYSKGYISYPRTDTNRYPKGFDFAKPLSAALNGLSVDVDAHIPRARNGMLDDGAHPPIYPVSPYHGSSIERDVWEYIARRFLANAFAGDASVVKQHARLTTVKGCVELYADGQYIKDEGFFKIYGYFMPKESRLPSLMVDSSVDIVSIDLVKAKTKPPSRLSEAELLEVMERHGIGTDATRAEFPSLLLKRGYATKVHNRFRPTPLGIAVIDALKGLDLRLVSPDARKMVEVLMKDIEDGKVKEDEALNRAIEIYQHLLGMCIKNIDYIAKRLQSA
ncbi:MULTISPECIES: DNA topoisomerase [Candidatus Nitrosocaldus]|jgi:DNA topoisomerase IA|uniref:DNA topoisomerase n=1 Tax=Candidatus Nitrosocaldus cavascurensis TaxID=2058097 RepID=A0A2K5APY2_9ARCH|nr:MULTISPECIES: type IA DNA topoisomerase [Candidatus Nitrosocaldus]SPC33667.1 DNA topoisomerase IA [Candidatus Nitrosocaldus cavascurensis]